MSEKQMRLGALEAGGTKMVCAVVSGDGEVLDRMETPTLAPAETVPQMIEWFAARDVDALGIGAFGTTVLQIFQNRQSLVYDIIGFFSFHIDDEANAAGIVFKCRIVQTLRCRQIT